MNPLLSSPHSARLLAARFAINVDEIFWKSVDFLIPPRCVACGIAGHTFCASCAAAVQLCQAPLCAKCGFPLAGSQGAACDFCSRHHLKVDRLLAAGMHRGPLQLAIHALKYRRNRALAAQLGSLMAAAWPVDAPANALLVPVPLARQRRSSRGFNQAEVLARQLGWRLGLRVDGAVLQRTRETRSQVGLGAVARGENVSGAFTANARRLRGRRAVLIDDVCTTGATLSECAVALRAAGAPLVWAFTLARAART